MRRFLVLAWLVLAFSAIVATAGAGIADPPSVGALDRVVATDAAGLSAGQPVAPAEAWRLALESEDSVPDAAPPLRGRAFRFPDVRPTAPQPPACAAWPAPIPILLLIQRQNE